MRDFPVFTTENGVGSLVLREIPYRGVAYITIHDSSDPKAFVHECVEFCRAVGAERVYASGHEVLEAYPLYTSVIRMSGNRNALAQTDACLFPVTEQTLSRWREIYNDKMKNVDNASYMSESAAQQMLKRGDGYFIHTNGDLLGIGIAGNDRIDCIASVKPGCGKVLVSTLAHGLLSEHIVLEVASTNSKAIRLYESLGFIKSAEISRWFKIF